MTKLKTLKDIDLDDCENVVEQNIRAEAVKWYKWHINKQYRSQFSVVEFITHFFNITGEDLK